MAVSMVSDPESEQELAESQLMLKNAWPCSGFKTGNPCISDFSTILTSDIQILADSSHLPSDEATCKICPSHAIVYQRLATSASPTRDIFSTKFSSKRGSWGKMGLFCQMTSVGCLEIMIQHTPSIICDFHFPVDFRLVILFPHIFWFLHQN
jgi:hypothetical protein